MDMSGFRQGLPWLSGSRTHGRPQGPNGMLEGSFSPVYIPSPARREPLFNVVGSTHRRGRSLASGLKPGRLPTGSPFGSTEPFARLAGHWAWRPLRGRSAGSTDLWAMGERGVWGAAGPPPGLTANGAQAQLGRSQAVAAVGRQLAGNLQRPTCPTFVQSQTGHWADRGVNG